MRIPVLPRNRVPQTSPSEVKPPETAELLDKEPASDREEPNQGPRNVLPIPGELWNREVDAITLFVEEELSVCASEREPMMRNLARWKEAYIAPPPSGPKHFPIYNSSNLTSAVIKEHAHVLIGQLVQSTVTTRPYAYLKDLAAEWEPYIDFLERFTDIAAERDFDYERISTMLTIEAAILGTAIGEVPYEVDERRVYRYTADGKRTYPTSVIFHDGPSPRHIPIGSFWIRMHETDPQKARWCAKRLLFSELELREREAQKKFHSIDKLLDHYAKPEEEIDRPRDLGSPREDPVRERENEVLDQKPLRPSRIEVFEIFISYDIDRDENHRFEELRLYYHRDSRMFIGQEFLPYWSGDRGFLKLEFFPRTDRFYAEGLAELLEQIQIAVSAIANRRADNATLANLKMILKRKILKNLQPGDPLYSGKIIEVNDIFNDVREFSLSEIYPSTVSEEQILRSLAERLSGVSEAASGAAMPVTRTTAAAQMALLQEQRNRIGLTTTNIRRAQRRIFQLSFNHYSQFGTNSKGLLWMGEKGRVVDTIFRLPRRVKELVQAVQITTPTSSQNKQVKRESSVAVFNLMMQLSQQLLPLVQMLAPEHLPEVVHGMVKSARYFMGEVLETFDITDPDAVLEGITTLEKLLPAPEDLGGMESFNRRAESSATIDGLSRVEALLREVEATRERQLESSNGDKRGRRTAPPERNGRGGDASILLGGESLFTRR